MLPAAQWVLCGASLMPGAVEYTDRVWIGAQSTAPRCVALWSGVASGQGAGAVGRGTRQRAS